MLGFRGSAWKQRQIFNKQDIDSQKIKVKIIDLLSFLCKQNIPIKRAAKKKIKLREGQDLRDMSKTRPKEFLKQ